jgi:hypothetical protein
VNRDQGKVLAHNDNDVDLLRKPSHNGYHENNNDNNDNNNNPTTSKLHLSHKHTTRLSIKGLPI